MAPTLSLVMLLNSAGFQVNISSVHSWSSQMFVVRTWFFSSWKIIENILFKANHSIWFFRVMDFCKIANVSCAKYNILWMSHVFAFLSFPHTTINPHWSRLAWIYVHPEKIQIWKYVHPEKILDICSTRKKTLDMCSPRKKANLGARNLILKGVVKNAPPCQSSSRIYPPCQRSEWELFRLW